MLKLLSITLTRGQQLLSGDGYSVLPDVLERLLPLLARPQLADLHAEAATIVARILSLMHATAPRALAALARATQALFEGAWGCCRIRSRGLPGERCVLPFFRCPSLYPAITRPAPAPWSRRRL